MLNKLTCKHFRGLCPGNETCKAGINPRDLDPAKGSVPGLFYRIPCKIGYPRRDLETAKSAREAGGGQGTCERFELPTDEEIEADKKAVESLFAEAVTRLEKVYPLIDPLKVEWRQKRLAIQRRVDCPVCGLSQGLFISIAQVNGHALVRCDSPDCLSFME